MKHIVIVAPHFIPSNLTAVHRSRLLASNLPAFGWTPTIVTVHERYYEEKLEIELYDLLPRSLSVKRAWAFPSRPFRLIGDVGVRGFLGMYQEIKKLHREKMIDFVYITIPSNYASLLGPLLYKMTGIPYGLDYIDPWVDEVTPDRRRFDKARLSQQMAKFLEPIAVKDASLITGIAPGYVDGVLKRNPQLCKRAVVVTMPYGWDSIDYEILRRHPRETFIFKKSDRKIHMVYAGAMLPKGYALQEIMLKSIHELKGKNPELMKAFKLHFIGTGKSADDPKGYNILPWIKKYHLEKWVEETPQRIGYLDTLNHLASSSAVLLMGSTEGHYFPSKVFQSILSRKPVLAILHQKSLALAVLRRCRSSVTITFQEGELPKTEEVVMGIQRTVSQQMNPKDIDEDINRLERFSAKKSTGLLVEAIERALKC